MLSKDLEVTLNRAYKNAQEKRHEFMTVEHLLLALLDDKSAVQVLSACGIDLSVLRQDLIEFIDATITRSLKHMVSMKKLKFNLLMGFSAFYKEPFFKLVPAAMKRSWVQMLLLLFLVSKKAAVYFLRLQNIARIDVVNFIAHGISKVSNEDMSTEGIESDYHQSDKSSDESSTDGQLLAQFTVNLNKKAAQGSLDPLVGRSKVG